MTWGGGGESEGTNLVWTNSFFLLWREKLRQLGGDTTLSGGKAEVTNRAQNYIFGGKYNRTLRA